MRKNGAQKERYNLGKMGLGQVYAGFCCPNCVGGKRWRKRTRQWFVRNKASLRDHRSGNFDKFKGFGTEGWNIYPGPVRRW